ncbi:MAG TPA: iron-sulfur cluster assembly scaffold protein [Sphingomicrobium sp.]|nr:iron-sulfur cluster assembly scaffold protein [Sphingomicrobium sp.]
MTAPLYTPEILRLAGSLPEPRALAAVHGSAERRSPACGSVVALDLALDAQGRIAALSQRVQACAFGQASAALLGRHAPGRTRDEVEAATEAFAGWLAGEHDDAGFWPGIAALEPARSRRSRHGAMLLPFRALVAAFEGARC